MPEWVMFALEGAVVIGAIFMGVRTGGIGLGLWGGVGVLVLSWFFREMPGDPPINAMLIILCVIAAAASMQAAGGTDYLVDIAAKIIRARPKQITIVAPIVAFFFTVAAGTGNIYFALLPVIYEVAYATGVRPERPLAASSTASQMGIVCSPVSAAMAAMLTLVGPGAKLAEGQTPIGLVGILAIVMPASIIAIVVASIVQNFVGKPLEEDPVYLERKEQGLVPPPAPIEEKTPEQEERIRKGRMPAFTFLIGVTLIVAFALAASNEAIARFGPGTWGKDGSFVPIETSVLIQLVMLTVATVIVMTSKVKPSDVVKQPVWTAGLVSMVALFGIAWLADTFIQANQALIDQWMGGMVQAFPLSFAVALFLFAALTTSQSGATRSIVPIGLTLGLSTAFLTAMWPSVIGIYAFPANGSQIAAVELDRTGTTKISKYVVWHSFTLSMLIGWVVAVGVGWVISVVFF